jgi:hypothetical protein
MFPFLAKQVVNILFRAIAPIYIISEENDPVWLFKVPIDDLLRGVQISVGISDKDDLPLRGKVDQPRLFFKYSHHILKKTFPYHFYPSAFTTLT